MDFNAVLLKISDSLSTEKLDRLKFLCKDVIGKREQEKCTTGFKLFQLLTERGKLGPGNTDFLCGLLTDINRHDLRDRLQGLSGDRSLPTGHGEQQDRRDELDRAAELLSENLGRNWRKLGRKLGLSEVKLDSISQKYPHNLEETAVELVRQWRRCSSDDQATVPVLIRALRECGLNMSADTVQDAL